MAMAARADNALRMGNEEAARGLVRQARDVLAGRAADAELDASLNLTEGWLALRQGDLPRAKVSFLASLKSPALSVDSTRNLRHEALSGLVKLEVLAHNFDAALVAQAELEALSAQSNGFSARDRVASDIGRGELLAKAGHYRSALTHTEAAIVRCGSSLGSSDARCRRLIYTKTMAMLRLGWPERVRPDLPVLHAIMDDTSSPDAQAAAMIPLFRVYSALGELAQQSVLADRVSAMINSSDDVGVDPRRKILGLVFIAEDRLRMGRAVEAEDWLKQAIAKEPARTGSEPSSETSIMAHMLMGVSLREQHRATDALPWLRQARVDRENALGPLHTLTLLSALNEAQVLQDLGRFQEALVLVHRAAPELRLTLGDDTPVYKRVTLLERSLRDEADVQPTQSMPAQGARTYRPAAGRRADDFFN